MINNFEEHTAKLNTYESEVIVPALAEILKDRIGASAALNNGRLCSILEERGFHTLNPSRIRKCINHIRTHGLVPHLIAGNGGYYCASSIAEVERYIESLDQRASAIIAVKNALREEVSGKLFI